MPLALLSNWKLLFGGGLVLVALLAIGVQTVRLRLSEATVAKYQGTVAMLTGTISELHSALQVQDKAVAEYKLKTDEATKAAQEALRKTQAAHAGDDARIAALVARMPAATPDAACKAADATILDFAK